MLIRCVDRSRDVNEPGSGWVDKKWIKNLTRDEIESGVKSHPHHHP
jgi:hypothetical protein